MAYYFILGILSNPWDKGRIQKDLRLVYTIMKSIYFLPILFKQNLETPATPLFFVSNSHRANNLNFLNECSREPDPFPLSYLKKQLFKNIKQQVLFNILALFIYYYLAAEPWSSYYSLRISVLLFLRWFHWNRQLVKSISFTTEIL